MTPELQISTRALNQLDRVIANRGGEPERLLSRYGLDIQALSDSAQSMSVNDFNQLLNECSAELNAPDLGMTVGAMQELEMLGPLGVLLGNCNSTAEVINAIHLYLVCHNQSEHWQFTEYDRVIVVQRFDSLDSMSDTRQYKELAITACYWLSRRLFGSGRFIEWVELSHAPMAALPRYADIFSCQLMFNRERDALVLNKAALEVDLGKSILSLKADALRRLQLAKNSKRRSVVQQVELLIEQHLTSRPVTLDLVADEMTLQKRTLQRMLQKQGVVFRDLLNNIKHKNACWYLRSNVMAITQIAELLGYTDLGNFSRAFAKKSGCSPRQWRAQHADIT